MINIFGRRGAAAVLASLLLALGAAPANAAGAGAPALGSISYNLATSTTRTADVASAPQAVVASAVGTVAQTFGRKPFAAEAAWLYNGGWSLGALVDKYAANEQLNEEMNCLATAVYFEARGESAEGQLAVARVVMNRAASGKYPPSWCATVKQPWQFSFVRHGQFPSIDTSDAAWGRAVAVAKLAAANIVPSLSNDVLWYHANYVRPAWGPRLVRVEKIGAHIFYRA